MEFQMHLKTIIYILFGSFTLSQEAETQEREREKKKDFRRIIVKEMRLARREFAKTRKKSIWKLVWIEQTKRTWKMINDDVLVTGHQRKRLPMNKEMRISFTIYRKKKNEKKALSAVAVPTSTNNFVINICIKIINTH